MNPTVGRWTSILRGLFELILLAALAPTLATGEPRFRLHANKTSVLQIGETVVVQMLVENVPPVYGVEMHLSFDPQLLEVMDANPDQADIQATPGDFLNPARGTLLQNRANNPTGKLDYTLALLNPAPPAQGSGWLFSVTFRAKAQGRPRVTINANSQFGTQTGQTIVPVYQDLELQIGGAPAPQGRLTATPVNAPTATSGPQMKGETKPETSQAGSLLPSANLPDITAILAVGAGLAILIGGGLWWLPQRKM